MSGWHREDKATAQTESDPESVGGSPAAIGDPLEPLMHFKATIVYTWCLDSYIDAAEASLEGRLRVVMANQDNNCRVVDLETGTITVEHQGHDSAVCRVHVFQVSLIRSIIYGHTG
jgi:hypothetical protein